MKPTETIYDQQHEGVGRVVVRYVGIGDAPIMLDYINELSREKTYITFQGEQQTLEDEQKHVDKAVQDMQAVKKVMLLMLVNDKLVGIGEINQYARVNSHVGGLGLSLAAEARGKQLGRLLIDLVIHEAQRYLVGLRSIELTCFANNEIAQNLYKKVGFVEVARIPEKIVYKGEYVDEIIMHKKIQS